MYSIKECLAIKRDILEYVMSDSAVDYEQICFNNDVETVKGLHNQLIKCISQNNLDVDSYYQRLNYLIYSDLNYDSDDTYTIKDIHSDNYDFKYRGEYLLMLEPSKEYIAVYHKAIFKNTMGVITHYNPYEDYSKYNTLFLNCSDFNSTLIDSYSNSHQSNLCRFVYLTNDDLSNEVFQSTFPNPVKISSDFIVFDTSFYGITEGLNNCNDKLTVKVNEDYVTLNVEFNDNFTVEKLNDMIQCLN